MTTNQFITEINECFPSVEKIIEKYRAVDPNFDLVKADAYLRNNFLEFNQTISLEADLVDQLIYNTNISAIGIGGISFSMDIYSVDGKGKEFATYNDFYSFCYDEITTQVKSYDSSYNDTGIVASSFDQFLCFLIEYDKYYKWLVFDVDYSRPERISNLMSLVKDGFSEKWLDILMPEINV
jgi:hypothetical protein